MSNFDVTGPSMCFFLDVDVSLPDEVLCYSRCRLIGGEKSGHSRKDREEGVGLEPHHGSFW